MMVCLPNAQEGFSLLEVMIALAVFSIGILAMASLACTSMEGLTIAQRTLYDSTAVGSYIEDLLSRSYADPLLVDKDDGFSPATPDHGPFDMDGDGGKIEWEVQDDYPIAGMKRIGVTVRRPFRGAERVLTYVYIKAKHFK